MKELFELIDHSPTQYHAIERVKEELQRAGAIECREMVPFQLEKGKHYYVTRNDSSLIAFSIPNEEPVGYRLYAAHSDSPCFKVKPSPEITIEKEYTVLNTEKYGGMIASTWLDRPVSVAGRVAYAEGNDVVTKTVNIEELTCVIPNVAIHMNREINKGYEYNPQVDMRPLMGVDMEGETLQSLIAQKLGIKEGDILGQDLYVYAKTPCCYMGYNQELIGGPRLDDLACVYAGMKGYLGAIGQEKNISVLAIFDHEEVGSGSLQGADSTFLTDVMERIEEGLGYAGEKAKCLRANSFLISADNAHGLHPNHPEKADPTNRPVLNHGIVIKYHGGQKYTTDAFSEATLKMLCKKAGISYQTYANRSDIAGGSTLGNIVATHLAIPAVDIGLPQLAMHSAFETAGKRDLADLCKLSRAFFMS